MTLRDYLDRGDRIEIRGDGKAGGGLLMSMEAFGKALGKIPNVEIQEWPLFSSARKGANVRAFMRIADHAIHTAASITEPNVAIVVDEATADRVDFAAGMDEGIYLLNTRRSAEETAKKYHLRGTVITVDGDILGERHLGQRIGNISIFAALVRVSGLLSDVEGLHALEEMMRKRRLPESIQQANSKCYLESLGTLDIQTIEGEPSWSHRAEPFIGFPAMPIGAQSSLRTSLSNRTATYRPTGFKLLFEDPTNKCSGCALCLTNCPENIIDFVPDIKRGLKVTGANVVDFCKLCQECVEICPVNLFSVEQEEMAE